MESVRKICFMCALFVLLLNSQSSDAHAQIQYEPSGGNAQSNLGIRASFSDFGSDQQPFESLSNTANTSRRSQGTLTSFLGIDGSKQPQDFGANANLGVAAQLNFSGPLWANGGIGFQIGSRVTFTGNAVQVFELLGESKDRYQNFTTLGLYQRFDSGFSYGFAYDYLNQNSFDGFNLGQWRFRTSMELSSVDEIGVTLNFSDRSDIGRFNEESVVLDPIEQLHVYWRHHWQSGVSTSFWLGVADRHSEENAITGTLAPKTNQLLSGAEFFAPLNDWMAIYGETNLMMPADTGAVDAYLGIQFAPRGIRRTQSRMNRFRSFMPVASSPTFTTDLNRR